MSAQSVVDGLYLFNQSPSHRGYTLVQFQHYFLLPLLHEKVRIFYDGDKPVALVTWCWLTEDESRRFLGEALCPAEEHYARQTGDQLWGVEFIAPFGHARRVMREMKKYSQQQYGHGETVHWRRLSAPNKVHKRRF